MGSTYDPELTLKLVGPLRLLRRDDGIDVTPRSTNARGLLALVGTAPALRRSRAWLQDKLWSDCTAEHGSASLRQTIHRLRLAVGPPSGWLISEAGWIGLDPKRVCVQLEPEASDWEATGEPPEFCEGLDIADPEFEDWIRDQRLAFEDRLGDRPAPPRAPSSVRALALARRDDDAMLFVVAADVEDRGVATLAQLLSVQVGMAVARMGGARVRIGETGADPPPDAMALAVQGCRLGDKAMLQARLCEDGVLVWSNNRTFPVGTSGSRGSAFTNFVAEVTATAVHYLGRGGSGEGASQVRAGYRAMEDLFTLDCESLVKCERIFAATIEKPAAAIHQAWRAQIRVISIIERLTPDPAQMAREAIDLIKQSLKEDPHNSVSNAIAADVALQIEGNPIKAAVFARSAIERDPCSPYAHASAAQAFARLGDAPKAHKEALHALRLAAALPNQSWWQMRCCITAVRCGHYREAARFAATAHALSPRFKPPLRFLAALLFKEGDEAGAAAALQCLKTLEPDFSLELMRREDYPVTSLRDTPLIEVTRSGLL